MCVRACMRACVCVFLGDQRMDCWLDNRQWNFRAGSNRTAEVLNDSPKVREKRREEKPDRSRLTLPSDCVRFVWLHPLVWSSQEKPCWLVLLAPWLFSLTSYTNQTHYGQLMLFHFFTCSWLWGEVTAGRRGTIHWLWHLCCLEHSFLFMCYHLSF